MTMIESTQRVDEFKAEIAAMRVPSAAPHRDRLFARLGLAGMALGIALGVIAYVLSHTTRNPLQQRDAIVVSILGLTVAVSSAAVFVRYSIAEFLRFWMARLAYEQQAATDRMVEAVAGPGGGEAREEAPPAAAN
jgi:hypothetical protein